jgi:cytochrome c oxidase subunit II
MRALVRRTAFVGLAFAASACSSAFGMPRGASRQGRAIFDLWQTMFAISIVVAAIVYGLIAFSVLRYRSRGNAEVIRSPREHPWLEITYTVIPVVIVAFLWFMSWRTNDDVTGVTSHPDVTVRVEAYSWGWRFSYPGLGVSVVSQPGGPVPEMVLPLGRTTGISLTSVDVIHAWYVPAFLYKHDAIPGRIARFDITPETTGVFGGACAEFCGLNHAFMRFAVRVVPPDRFAAWVERTASTPSATPSVAASPSPSPSPSVAVATGPTGSSAEASTS